MLTSTKLSLLAKPVGPFLNAKKIMDVMPNGPLKPADGTLGSRAGGLCFDYTTKTLSPTNLIARMDAPAAEHVLSSESLDWGKLTPLQQRASSLLHATERSAETTRFANALAMPQGVTVPLDLLAEIGSQQRSADCAFYALVEEYMRTCPHASAADKHLCLQSIVHSFVHVVKGMWGTGCDNHISDVIAKAIFLWAMLHEEHGYAFTVSKSIHGKDTCTPLRCDFGFLIRALNGILVKASFEGKASNQRDRKLGRTGIHDSSLNNCFWGLAVFHLAQHVNSAEELCKCVMGGDCTAVVHTRQHVLLLECYNFVADQARLKEAKLKEDALQQQESSQRCAAGLEEEAGSVFPETRVPERQWKIHYLRNKVCGYTVRNGRTYCGAGISMYLECDGGGDRVKAAFNANKLKYSRSTSFSQQPSRDVSLLSLFQIHVSVNGAHPPPPPGGGGAGGGAPGPAAAAAEGRGQTAGRLLQHCCSSRATSEAPSACTGIHTSVVSVFIALSHTF
jgi:hypothetical protein